MKPDVIILGGGAAGLFCAAQAGARGQRVLVLERNAKVGRKIIISGGGRCNFTNIHAGPEAYFSANPHFCKSALARYTQHDFIELVERHHVPYFEKRLGQLFCEDRSSRILDVLLRECSDAGVTIQTGVEVTGLRRDGEAFVVQTATGETFEAPKLVIATGGPSIPKMGATAFGYDIARQFGHSIVETHAALVPLLLGGDDGDFTTLTGVSLDVVARAGGHEFREAALFTHRGLSGPAILEVSTHWRKGEPLVLDLLPDGGVEELLDSPVKAELRNALAKWFPSRFAELWARRSGADKPVNQIARKKLEALVGELRALTLHPTGDEGYAKAEVTRGGVDTNELSSKTMESRKVAGLYFIGEVVDVTGRLGGYNFQWAWSSAHACAQAL